jgi:hypothetical protein
MKESLRSRVSLRVVGKTRIALMNGTGSASLGGTILELRNENGRRPGVSGDGRC